MLLNASSIFSAWHCTTIFAFLCLNTFASLCPNRFSKHYLQHYITSYECKYHSGDHQLQQTYVCLVWVALFYLVPPYANLCHVLDRSWVHVMIQSQFGCLLSTGGHSYCGKSFKNKKTMAKGKRNEMGKIARWMSYREIIGD